LKIGRTRLLVKGPRPAFLFEMTQVEIVMRVSSATPGNQAIDRQNYQRAENSESYFGEEAGISETLRFPREVKSVCKPACEDCARYSQNHSDGAAAGVFAWHQNLGNRTCNQADDNPRNYISDSHIASLFMSASSSLHAGGRDECSSTFSSLIEELNELSESNQQVVRLL
jgi:uncharacterized protein YbcV (DUF1398 family)